jgi:hypothetical protein
MQRLALLWSRPRLPRYALLNNTSADVAALTMLGRAGEQKIEYVLVAGAVWYGENFRSLGELGRHIWTTTRNRFEYG